MKKLVLIIAVSLVSFVVSSQDSLTKLKMAESAYILLNDYNKSNKPLIDYILQGFNKFSNSEITEVQSKFLFNRLKRFCINESIITQQISINTNADALYFSNIDSDKDSVFNFLNGKTIGDIEIVSNSYASPTNSKFHNENDNISLYITFNDNTQCVYGFVIYNKKLVRLSVVVY